MRALVCTLDVDVVDEIPVRLLHVLEADIAQDAGIVDEHIDAPKGIDGRLDDGLSILHRVVVGDRFAACGADLVDDLVGGLRVVSAGRPKHVKMRCASHLRLRKLVKTTPSAVAVNRRIESDIPVSPCPRP
jgi:hypothetical protein